MFNPPQFPPTKIKLAKAYKKKNFELYVVAIGNAQFSVFPPHFHVLCLITKNQLNVM